MQQRHARPDQRLEDQGEKRELRSRSRRPITGRSKNVRRTRKEVHDQASLVPLTPNYSGRERRFQRLIVGWPPSSDRGMRKNILAAGITLLAVAFLFGISYSTGLLFTIPISVLNIILGLVTSTPQGLEIQPESASIRLVVDRGVVRASIYQLVFLNSKLILKRLSSVSVTVILALVLAVVGLEVLGIIGALMGGITGFSLQEFLTQRMRNKIENEMQLTSIGRGDIEIEYADLREVRLVKSRLHLIAANGSLAASLPRGYSGKIKPMLASIFGSKFITEELIRAVQAAEEENEKRQHPGGDRGKFPRR